jgi:hypothetical protein
MVLQSGMARHSLVYLYVGPPLTPKSGCAQLWDGGKLMWTIMEDEKKKGRSACPCTVPHGYRTYHAMQIGWAAVYRHAVLLPLTTH